MRTSWTRDEIVVAYAIYCITPINRIRLNNKLLQQIAEGSKHSLSSWIMRVQNFRYMDPKNTGGLKNVAKLDKTVFEEFRHDWGELSVQAEQISGYALFDANPIHGAKRISSLTNKKKVTRERVFFREAVMSAYNYKCCISGTSVPKLLIASHIKPYSKCNRHTERTNPENGLCLNVFYDKAFDQGLITIDSSLRIYVAHSILDNFTDDFTMQWLHNIQGECIIVPERFQPDKYFLEYHNSVIFKG